MKKIDLASATKLVSDFHDTLKAHNTAHAGPGGFKEQFEVATRGRLFDMLSPAYDTSLALTSDPVLLGQVCVHYGTNAPKDGENLHSAPVRIMFGTKNKASGKLEVNRSAWKYGKAFRAAQALGWKAGEFANRAPDYVLVVTKDGKEKKLKGLIALETYDTQEHGNPEAEVSEAEKLAAISWMARKHVPLATVMGAFAEAPKHRQMVGLLAQFDETTSEWHIRAVNQGDSDRAWATIAKPMMQQYRDWVAEAALRLASDQLDKLPPDDIAGLLEALDQQHQDVDAHELSSSLSHIPFFLNTRIKNGVIEQSPIAKVANLNLTHFRNEGLIAMSKLFQASPQGTRRARVSLALLRQTLPLCRPQSVAPAAVVAVVSPQAEAAGTALTAEDRRCRVRRVFRTAAVATQALTELMVRAALRS